MPEHEQDFWLRKAEELSWSRNRLRQEVRASLAERTTADDPEAARASLGGPDAVGARIQVRLSPEQLESCQTAAGRLGRSIEEWAAFALDRVACEELGRENASIQPYIAALFRIALRQ